MVREVSKALSAKPRNPTVRSASGVWAAIFFHCFNTTRERSITPASRKADSDTVKEPVSESGAYSVVPSVKAPVSPMGVNVSFGVFASEKS